MEFLLIDSMYTILQKSSWGMHDKANQVEVSFTNFCNFYYLLMWTTRKFHKNIKYERTTMSIWTFKFKLIKSDRIWWKFSAHNLAFKKRFLVLILKLEGKSNTIYYSWSIFDILLCNITDSCFPVGKVYHFIIF